MNHENWERCKGEAITFLPLVVDTFVRIWVEKHKLESCSLLDLKFGQESTALLIKAVMKASHRDPRSFGRVLYVTRLYNRQGKHSKYRFSAQEKHKLGFVYFSGQRHTIWGVK